MATVEIELGENGEIGKLPDVLQKFFDKRIDEAYQKGADKAEKRLSPLAVDPKELEGLRSKAKDLEDLQLQIAERDKNYEEAQKIRDKRHIDELKKEQDAHALTRKRVREFANKAIRSAAVEAGARAESLDELERLIGADVDFDQDMSPFIKGPDGNPLEKDGVKVEIEGYVREYLERKPHHKAAPPAKGGQAPGGRTLRGGTPLSDKEAWRQKLEEDDSEQNQVAFVGRVLRGRG